MSDWIRAEAQKIKRAEQADTQRAARLAEEQEAARAGWLKAWIDILQCVDTHVRAFNAEFPSEPKKHIHVAVRLDHELLAQRRTGQGTVGIQVTVFDGQARLTVRRSSADHAQQSHDQEFRFGADEGGRVGLVARKQVVSSDQAAEIILRNLFTG